MAKLPPPRREPTPPYRPSITEKLEANAYTIKRQPPIMPRKPSTPTWFAGRSIEDHLNDVRAYEQAVRQFADDVAAFKLDMQSYDTRCAELEAEFKADLFEDLGITGHPKAELLYHKAHERSHHEGRRGVYETAADLVGLILD